MINDFQECNKNKLPSIRLSLQAIRKTSIIIICKPNLEKIENRMKEMFINIVRTPLKWSAH